MRRMVPRTGTDVEGSATSIENSHMLPMATWHNAAAPIRRILINGTMVMPAFGGAFQPVHTGLASGSLRAPDY